MKTLISITTSLVGVTRIEWKLVVVVVVGAIFAVNEMFRGFVFFLGLKAFSGFFRLSLENEIISIRIHHNNRLHREKLHQLIAQLLNIIHSTLHIEDLFIED